MTRIYSHNIRVKRLRNPGGKRKKIYSPLLKAPMTTGHNKSQELWRRTAHGTP